MDVSDLPSAAGRLFANRFEVDRLVGAGGMGLVYRARDRYSGAWVALKVLHDSLVTAPLVTRFLREAQILAELGHPHIVSYVAHGESADGRRFLAMEWLEGQDLAERLRQDPLNLSSALRLLEHIADGLAAAHQGGILHRDLKPANLFLVHGELEQVKILDFGIARRTAGNTSFTQAGTAIGTPEYMAPEQARGLQDISAAADIFSLGCVFHQCLTGKSPFAADSAAASLVRILFDDAPLLAHPPADFPSGVLTVLRKMLAKEPAQRFPDASALLAALRNLRAAESTGTTGEVRAPITLSGYTLASSEVDQEIFSVVIVQPPSENTDDTSTISTERAESQEFLVASLQTMGVRVESVLGGALVVTVPPMESAVDQAAQAARAALLIKRLWPHSRVALATGRGVVKGQMAVGEVASRALQMLAQSGEKGVQKEPVGEAQTCSGVWTDRLSAQLLPQSFQLTGTGEQRLLKKEQEAVDESRPLLGKPTPCVGREVELNNLDGHLGICLNEGEFRGVLVTGSPGSGKSRLRHEFLRRVAQGHAEVRILVGRGDLLSAGAPYHILATALRGFFGLSADLSSSSLCERLEAIAAACNGAEATDAVSRILPEFLGELAGRSLPEERYPALRTARQDPSLMHFQLRRTFVAWLEHESKKGPLLFLLDDLHWGDALSVALLDHAMQELPTSPWFVLALSRPEVHTVFPKLWHGRPVHEVALKGLSRKACERLIQHALGSKVPAPVAAKIIEQAAGNALFLEELIRAAAEGNEEALPETVLAMLQARIGRLPIEARRTLRAASVFGQTFYSGGLAAVLDTTPEDRLLQEALQTLITHEFIERQGDSAFPGQVQYGFRHILMREAAYALLAESDRVALHRQAGLFLAVQAGVEPKMVAEHLEKGHEPRRAVPWFLRAARHAFDSNDLAAAMSYADQGHRCGAEGEELATFRALKREIAYWTGDYPRCRALAEEELLQLRTGTASWYQAMTRALVARGRSGDLSGLDGLCTEMLEAPLIGESVVEKIICLCRLTHVLRISGATENAQPLYQAAANLIETHRVASPKALAQYHEARSLVGFASPLDALQHVEKAVANYEKEGDVRNVLFNRCGECIALAWLGAGRDAESRLRANIATCQKMSFRPALATAQMGLAMQLVRERRLLSEARQLLLQARTWYREIKFLFYVKVNSLAFAELERIERNYDQALTWITESRSIAKTTGVEDLYFGVSFALEAQCLLGLGRDAEALPAARRAYALPRVAHGISAAAWEHLPNLALAEVLSALGEKDEARQVLGILCDWLRRRIDRIPNPEWRSELLRIPDYTHILELAAQLGVDASFTRGTEGRL